MTVIGITGPTGAGKTTALRALKDMGALVIDCDDVYHVLLAHDDEMLAEIKARFPEAFSVDGVLNRRKLGEVVFADAGALKDLNAITHQYVRQEVRKRISGWGTCGGTLTAIDAIALPEGGLNAFCDFKVAVTAPLDTRIRRIVERDGISRDYAMLRANAQHNEEYFTKYCDYVIKNDGPDKKAFYNKCRKFFEELLAEKS